MIAMVELVQMITELPVVIVHRVVLEAVVKMIFVQCIHVRIMVNVYLKAIVDVVFVHHRTMVMIVEKFIDRIHAIMSIVPMVNVVMASVNVMRDIQALDAIYHLINVLE